MNLVTYEYYVNDYKGNMLGESDFDYYARKASAEVNHATFGRLAEMEAADIPDEALDAICEVAEQYSRVDQTTEGGIVASANNDGYSVSFRDTGDAEYQQKAVRSIIRKYLGCTGLLYRGVMK